MNDPMILSAKGLEDLTDAEKIEWLEKYRSKAQDLYNDICRDGENVSRETLRNHRIFHSLITKFQASLGETATAEKQLHNLLYELDMYATRNKNLPMHPDAVHIINETVRARELLKEIERVEPAAAVMGYALIDLTCGETCSFKTKAALIDWCRSEDADGLDFDTTAVLEIIHHRIIDSTQLSTWLANQEEDDEAVSRQIESSQE